MITLLGALLLATLCAQVEPQEVPAFHPPLERKDLGSWWISHARSGTEMPWQLRPWQHELAQGVEQAWQEHRPLLIWLEEGHPFAAVPARALQVRDQWLAPELAAPLREFVLVADDLSEILRRGGAAAAWLQQAADGSEPLQPGILLATLDGRRLGFCDGLDAKVTAATLTGVLQQWADREAEFPRPSPADRPGPLPREPRDADSFPLDGFALEITHHRLENAEVGAPEFFDGPLGRDVFWIAGPESGTLRPSGQAVNARGSWAPPLAQRLARAVLAEGAAGSARAWAAADVKLAELQLVAQVRRQGRTGVALTGRFVAQRGGSWLGPEDDPFGAGQWQGAQPDARGARAKALGWMELDAKTGAVLSFRLLVLAQHWDARGVRQAAALLGKLSNGEEGMRYAPSLRAEIPAAGGLALHRTLYAEQAPELDGSLAEPVWAGSPWSLDFAGAPGTRARAVWDNDLLYLAAWTAAAELRVELAPPGGGAALPLILRADGSVEGLEGARCAVKTHGAGAEQAWVYELMLPWTRINQALKREAAPAPGDVWSAAWQAGAGTLATRLVLEPSRAQATSFGSGATGGFR